jgi:hypothetical protein
MDVLRVEDVEKRVLELLGNRRVLRFEVFFEPCEAACLVLLPLEHQLIIDQTRDLEHDWVFGLVVDLWTGRQHRVVGHPHVHTLEAHRHLPMSLLEEVRMVTDLPELHH